MSSSRQSRTPDPKIKLADLEALIAAELKSKRLAASPSEIQSIGNPIVKAGRLIGYSAERYGSGDWLSVASLKRIQDLVGSQAPGAEAAKAVEA